MSVSIDLCWRPDGDLAGPDSIAIVVDILRASSTVTTVLAGGANAVWVRTEVEAARALASELGALLVGERHNARLPGFDFGNAPAELAVADLDGRNVVLTSTNFPHALEAARGARAILAGSLLNLASTLDDAFARAEADGLGIDIVLAGEPSDPNALEDLYFGVRACAALADRCTLSEKAQRALDAYGALSPAEAMARSVHAGELVADGFAADVEFVQDVDRFPVVVLWEGRRFRCPAS